MMKGAISMVKLIMGLSGSGKTKQLIALVNQASVEESGDVVCIEKNTELMFDIPHSVRLVCTKDYSFGSIEFLKGFISGLHAGNYDITHIFIDNLEKVVENSTPEDIEKFILWCNDFSEKESVKFSISLSADEKTATEAMKAFL